jgi:hypothetical protein
VFSNPFEEDDNFISVRYNKESIEKPERITLTNDEDRRNKHNQSERIRRAEIKDGLTELRNLIPTNSKRKLSKSVVLKKGLDYY